MTEFQTDPASAEGARVSPELGFSFADMSLREVSLNIAEAARETTDERVEQFSETVGMLEAIWEPYSRVFGNTWPGYAAVLRGYELLKSGAVPEAALSQIQASLAELLAAQQTEIIEVQAIAQSIIERHPTLIYRMDAPSAELKALTFQWAAYTPAAAPEEIPVTLQTEWSDGQRLPLHDVHDTLRLRESALPEEVRVAYAEYDKETGVSALMAHPRDV